MTAEWHVGPELWQAYRAGALDAAIEASVETHVTGCARCRDAARAVVPDGHADETWRAVQAVVVTPRLARPVRWMRRLGVPEQDLVLLGAADAVLLPWVTAVGAALACALVSGLTGLSEVAFFALAPLVPVLAVVAAFDATESLREVSVPTPYSKLRLALLRTTAALVVALPVTITISLLVPVMSPFAFSWVLPGLVLTCAALLLLTWLPPWEVVGVLSLVWSSGVAVLGGFHRVDALAAGGAQLLFGVATATTLGVFVARTGGLRWTGVRSL